MRQRHATRRCGLPRVRPAQRDSRGRDPISRRRIPANSVFNPGAARVGDETILLVRVEDLRGISQLHVVRSADGVTGWTFDPEPLLRSAAESHPEEIWGCEDPRLTWLPEREEWAIAYTAYSSLGPLVSLAMTRDFRSVTRLGPVMPPEDKDAALFPVRFDGRWAMIHRPSPLRGKAHMWVSSSPDLRHWGDHALLLEARDGAWWDANKIGLGPPPLETAEGWLVMYHGVHMTGDGPIYRVGLALLDLADPHVLRRRMDEWVFGPSASYELMGDVGMVVFPCGWTSTRPAQINLTTAPPFPSVSCCSISTNPHMVLHRTDEWVFGPIEPYELSGDVGRVVFPCGWTLDEASGQINLYYGAADSTIAVATARLDDVWRA